MVELALVYTGVARQDIAESFKMLKNKKVLITIGVIILSLIVFVVLITSSKEKDTSITDRSQSQAEPYKLPESKINLEEIPTEPDKVIVGETETKNFYKSAQAINESGSAVVNKSQDYEIVYTPEFSQFNITVLGSPFTQARKAAEIKFIETLGINTETACKLNVVVSTPYFANPNESGQSYGLSFCN